MATTIKFTADGIKDEMLVPSIGFSLSSSADVTNTSQQINFGPIRVSEFSFSIESPTPDTVKKLIEWITNHDVKKQAKFSIFEEAITKNARIISLKDVCLTSFLQNIESSYTSINLSVIGRKVNIDDIEIDLSKAR
jgi:hypothetical protein